MRGFIAALVLAIAAPAISAAQQPEALSLLGKPLVPPALSGDDRKAADADMVRARAAYDADPKNADATLALARATALTGRITEALAVYTRGIEAHPDDARFYLERGRYYVVIRKFDVALKDLRKAAEAQPEARCDAGIASYLKGDFPAAREALRTCRNQPWPYLAELRAGGKPKRAALPQADKLVSAYTAAAEQIAAGHADQARDMLKTIVEKHGDDWMQPAYIAAEADYARIRRHASRRR